MMAKTPYRLPHPVAASRGSRSGRLCDCPTAARTEGQSHWRRCARPRHGRRLRPTRPVGESGGQAYLHVGDVCRADPSTLVQLTPTELRIAQLASQGMSNKDVAELCSISPSTVTFHVRNVFTKTGVTSRG